MILRHVSSSQSVLSILCTLGVLLPAQVQAIWPFPQRQSTIEALVDAGSLGLDGELARVVAIGDWNGDQHSDLFTLSRDGKTLQVHLWDNGRQRYQAASEYTSKRNIRNVVPADWNYDGRLDVLLVTEGEKHGWWGGGSDALEMQVVLQDSGGTFGDTWDLPTSSAAQPIVFDADGSLRPSLLGFPNIDGEDSDRIQLWANDGSSISLQSPPLLYPEGACKLANPHSSAFVDIEGDCVPDLVLHCAGETASRSKIQIWLNRGSKGYELSKTYDLPRGAGSLTFADMNRDGSIDIVFPICERHSASTGVATDCSIAIAYNQQAPLCSGELTAFNADQSVQCRGWGELCVADPGFAFSFVEGNDSFTSIPISSLIPSISSLLLSAPDAEHISLPFRIGDYNQDGFPDILLTVVNSTARPGFGFGGRQGTQVKVLDNVACTKDAPGCGIAYKGKRTFRAAGGRGWEVLEGMWDVVGASWMDVDDDGSLDIMVQRSGEQEQDIVTFIRNQFYHDAFFLRAQVLNGACDGPCTRSAGGAGSSAIGASYKFTVLDTLGRRGAQQIPQIPQTGYHALSLPYSFIGLGRTNNYIERLSVGVSLQVSNVTSLDSIIPNSQLLITPPSAPAAPSRKGGDAEAQQREVQMREWHTELFLQPGQWVPWVGLSVVGTVLALGGVVWFLHEREKSEDEIERRRALHAINFQAL